MRSMNDPRAVKAETCPREHVITTSRASTFHYILARVSFPSLFLSPSMPPLVAYLAAVVTLLLPVVVLSQNVTQAVCNVPALFWVRNSLTRE
jgi:hypothetical protein